MSVVPPEGKAGMMRCLGAAPPRPRSDCKLCHGTGRTQSYYDQTLGQIPAGSCDCPHPDEVVAAHKWGTNAALIADVATLGYLDGRVLDTTYGDGAFWTKYRPADLTTNDLYKDADCRESYLDLSWDDSEFDVVVFDPPYKLSGTPSTPTMDAAYGIEEYMPWQERMEDIRLGALECYRVTRRWLLVKCMDQVCSGAVRWQTHMVNRAIEDFHGRQADEFQLLKTPRKQRSQVTARRNYSTLMVFEKPRSQRGFLPADASVPELGETE